VTRPPLVYIPASSTIGQALSILSFSSITSAPVYDPVGNWFYGFFEIYDVLTYLMKTFVGKEPDTRITNEQWRSFGGDLSMLSFKGSSFANHNILDLIGPQHQLQVLPIGVPLTTLVSRLTTEHRVIIDTGAQATYSISTQLDLVKFLANNLNHFSPTTIKQTVKETGLGHNKRVYTVDEHSLTIAAFHTMWLYDLSCVAVVNSRGELLANLSITDLKALSQSNFGHLLDPVGLFISAQVWAPKLPPITVSLDSSFEHILLLLAACKIHHVWVTDDRNHPIRLISTGEIVRFLDSKIRSAVPGI